MAVLVTLVIAVLPMLFLIAPERSAAIGAQLCDSGLLNNEPTVRVPPGLSAAVGAEEPRLLTLLLLDGSAALPATVFCPFRRLHLAWVTVAVRLNGVQKHSERHGYLCRAKALGT